MHPGARELLTWYGVGIDAQALRMTFGQLCRMEGLDVEDALAELAESMDDDFEYGHDDDDPDHDDYGSYDDGDDSWFDDEE